VAKTEKQKLDDALELIGKYGRFGDTEFVHVNKDELNLLTALRTGPAVSINPITGMREFYDNSTGSTGDPGGNDSQGPGNDTGMGSGNNTSGDSGNQSSVAAGYDMSQVGLEAPGEGYGVGAAGSDAGINALLGEISARTGLNIADPNYQLMDRNAYDLSVGFSTADLAMLDLNYQKAVKAAKDWNDSLLGKAAGFIGFQKAPSVSRPGELDTIFSVNPVNVAATVAFGPVGGLVSKGLGLGEEIGVPSLSLNLSEKAEVAEDDTQTEFGGGEQQAQNNSKVFSTPVAEQEGNEFGKFFGDKFKDALAGFDFPSMPQFELLNNNFGEDFEKLLAEKLAALQNTGKGA
jgi:hypothetical protein